MTTPDLDLVQLEALAQACDDYKANSKTPVKARDVLALLARVKAAEEERTEARQQRERMRTLAREECEFARADAVKQLRAMQAERDAAHAAGIEEGLEKAAKTIEKRFLGYEVALIATVIRAEIKL